jgi:hypothetical protein
LSKSAAFILFFAKTVIKTPIRLDRDGPLVSAIL